MLPLFIPWTVREKPHKCQEHLLFFMLLWEFFYLFFFPATKCSCCGRDKVPGNSSTSDENRLLGEPHFFTFIGKSDHFHKAQYAFPFSSAGAARRVCACLFTPLSALKETGHSFRALSLNLEQSATRASVSLQTPGRAQHSSSSAGLKGLPHCM